MNMKTKILFPGDQEILIDMLLCLRFVLQEFGMIWLIDIDEPCLEGALVRSKGMAKNS